VKKDPFKEYIRESEPDKRDKGYAWHTAIGLQTVDGLKTSDYLVHTAVRNIEGEISFEEANALLQSYYEENPAGDTGDRTEEADKVAARIAALLSERAFSFTPNEYLSIHRKLFIGIYPHAGRIRDYNITKKEWVLNGATVLYGSATELRATLDYDFSEEMINESRDYFLNGDHLTILAMDGNDVIGCASISFIRIMPAFDHITGKRAHLMNVYTRNEYRRQGIARRMVQQLIDESWKAGATEISLDATELGRPLYESLGFNSSAECMVLTREKYD
jgi:GNAT superfamily N-acetyltransferase